MLAHARLPRTLLWGVVLPCVASCGSGQYLFGVAGQVLDSGGEPVAGARVILSTDRPVYDAGTPVGSPAIETDVVGWFAFTYTTHHLPTHYVIRVEKQGCPPEEVSSVAPPSQEHSVKLSCRMPPTVKAR